MDVNDEFLIVGERSGRGDFSMVAAVLVSTILERLPLIQRIILWISIAFVILLPMYFFLLRKTILVPLRRTIQVMKKIQQGDLHSRIEIHKVPEEFRIVNDAFNKMMAEISELKINILYSLARTQKYGTKHFYLVW